MSKHNITVRLDSQAVTLLDRLAESLDRDRSYLIKQAVDSYIEMHQWQLDEIEKAIAEADAGNVLPHKKVVAMLDTERK
jgi:predicted transcriptional regulator